VGIEEVYRRKREMKGEMEGKRSKMHTSEKKNMMII
jgi:hypothetical protein